MICFTELKHASARIIIHRDWRSQMKQVLHEHEDEEQQFNFDL